MALPLECKMIILSADKRLIGAIVTVLGAGCSLLALSKIYGPPLIRVSIGLVLVISPVIPLLWGQAVYAIAVPDGRPPSKEVPNQSSLPNASTGTIWVLLFDELDQRYAFDNPPPGLDLSAFSRFRNQALTATHAYPPGNSTAVSVPSLLLGRVIKETNPLSKWTAMLVPLKGAPFAWSGEDTVFQDFRQAGLTVSAYGWYLPYRRLFQDAEDRVHGNAIEYEEHLLAARKSMWRAPLLYTAESLGLGRLLNSVPTHALISLHTRNHRLSMSFLASEVQSGPANIVWVHFPIPHSPQLEDGSGRYVDNLKAADEALQQLEALLTAQNRWDADTILVSSDHGVRPETVRDQSFTHDPLLEDRASVRDTRVPFMVKLPGQQSPILVTKPFQTVRLRAMLNMLRKGEVKHPRQLAEWMNDQRQLLVPNG